MGVFVFGECRVRVIFVHNKFEMKIFFKIIIKEFLTIILALLFVMAAGLLINNDSAVQLRSAKKFEIKSGE